MSGKPLTLLMADSNIESISSLITQVEVHPDIKQILVADTIELALYRIVTDQPDMVFVDLGKQGFDLLDILRKNNIQCKVVITNSNINTAISAIQNNVYDFLLKPMEYEAVIRLVNQVLETVKDNKSNQLVPEEESKIRLSTVSDYIFVDPKEIVYCAANGSYTKIFMDNGSSEFVNYYLGKVSKKLSSERFYRISRFYLINVEKLYKINKYDGYCTLTLGDDRITLPGTKKSLRNLCNIDF